MVLSIPSFAPPKHGEPIGMPCGWLAAGSKRPLRSGTYMYIGGVSSIPAISFVVFSPILPLPMPKNSTKTKNDNSAKTSSPLPSLCTGTGCSRAITTRGISCTTKIPMGNTASLWWTSIGFTSGKQPCRTACARSHSSPVSAFHNWPPLSAGIATFVIGT